MRRRQAGWIEETKRCGEQSGEEWLRGMERLGMGKKEKERGRGTKVGVGPAADRREIPKGRGRGGCWAETERQTELS